MINVNQLDGQEVAGLARLKALPNQKLVEVIRNEIDKAKSKLTKADDMVLIHRLQGRVEAYEDLLKASEDAEKVNPQPGMIP